MNAALVLVRGAGGVAQRHAHARQQLAGAEGLGQVVVGAGVERGDLVALLAARRQHDDRHVRPLAQAPDHLQAVDVGQAEIEDDDVGLARGHLDQAVGAGRRLEEPVALARQGRAQEAPDLRLVLDDRTTTGSGIGGRRPRGCSAERQREEERDAAARAGSAPRCARRAPRRCPADRQPQADAAPALAGCAR